MSIKISKKISRRESIGTTSAAMAGFTIVPGTVISGFGHIAPSDKLNVAGIGIGGKGKENLLNIASKLSGQVLKFDPEKFNFPEMPEADKYFHYQYFDGGSP
jgi:hypothetical protein